MSYVRSVATSNKTLRFSQPNVVGTLHEMRGWRQAVGGFSLVDVFEVRGDALPRPPDAATVARLSRPVILTVRDAAEGGARPLSLREREELYRELLPSVAAVDIEAANLRALSGVVRETHTARRKVIGSFHDFQGVPSRARLRMIIGKARALGADCVKIAATPHSPAELVRLLELLEGAHQDAPLSVMPMGPYGRAARLLFALCGSCLNYAWLGAPQVPGQWSAREFSRMLEAAQK